MATSKTPLVADLSHHNTVTSFADVYASGIRGVILKASQGSTNTDATYAQRRKDARWAGLLVGAYHFGDSSTVKNQVSNFLRVSDPDANTLLALDWEPNGRWTMSLDQAKEFLQLVYDRTGQVPVLYSGNLVKETLGDRPDPFLAKHRLWLAQYGPKAVLPKGWDAYWLHQFTGDGQGPGPHEIPGVKDKGVDLNCFGGKDLAAEWVCRTARNVVELNPLKSTIAVLGGAAGGSGAANGIGGAAGGGGGGTIRSSGGNGVAAFAIPAADPPKDELTFTADQLDAKKVTASDLLPVSRKVTRLTLLKHAGHVAIGGIGVDKVMAWLGMAEDTRKHVEGFVGDHMLVIGLSALIVVVLVARDIIGLVVDDINTGRAVASGSVTPTQG